MLPKHGHRKRLAGPHLQQTHPYDLQSLYWWSCLKHLRSGRWPKTLRFQILESSKLQWEHGIYMGTAWPVPKSRRWNRSSKATPSCIHSAVFFSKSKPADTRIHRLRRFGVCSNSPKDVKKRYLMTLDSIWDSGEAFRIVPLLSIHSASQGTRNFVKDSLKRWENLDFNGFNGFRGLRTCRHLLGSFQIVKDRLRRRSIQVGLWKSWMVASVFVPKITEYLAIAESYEVNMVRKAVFAGGLLASSSCLATWYGANLGQLRLTRKPWVFNHALLCTLHNIVRYTRRADLNLSHGMFVPGPAWSRLKDSTAGIETMDVIICLCDFHFHTSNIVCN